MLAVLLAGASAAMLGGAAARAQSTTDPSPCVTQSECDLRADQRATEARQAEWNANAKAQEDGRADLRRIEAATVARHESGRLSRVQEIMRRRREAAAQGGN